MKGTLRVVLLLALLLTFYPVFSEDWTYRCYDSRYQDFIIYLPEYLDCIGAAKITFQPTWYSSVFSIGNSSASFLGQKMPILPLMEEYTIFAGRNYTIFVPFQYVEGSLNVLLAADVSNERICKAESFEINNSIRKACDLLHLEANISYAAEDRKFKVDLLNKDDVAYPVFVAVANTSGYIEEVFTIYADKGIEASGYTKKEYKPLDVSSGKYVVFVYAMANGKVYLSSKAFFEFYDVTVSFRDVPEILPSKTYTFYMDVRNTGTLVDCYDMDIDATPGFEVSTGSIGCLERNEEKEVPITIKVPEVFSGNAYVHVVLRALKGGYTREYNVTIYPQKSIKMEIIPKEPLEEVISFAWNNISATLVGKSTVPAKMFYVVYTIPSLRIEEGFGTVNFYSGALNRLNGRFYLGASCAFQKENNKAYQSIRKTLTFAEAIFEAVQNKDVNAFNRTKKLVEEEEIFIKASDYARSKVLPRLNGLLKDAEDFFSCSDEICMRNAKENVYLDLVDYRRVVDDYAAYVSKNCYGVREVEFHLFIYYPESGDSWDKSWKVKVVGKNIIELIGDRDVYLIPGRTKYVYYTIKNNADEDLELKITTDFQYLKVPQYLYIKSGESKTIAFRFSVPDYYESSGENVTVTISGRGIETKYHLRVVAGQFSPEIEAEKSYTIVPGKENEIPIRLITNGIDDNFTIFIKGPYWIKYPKEVSTHEGEAEIILIANAPPETTISKEYVTINAVPKHFEGMKATRTIKLIISEEFVEIQQEYQNLLKEYNRTAEKMSPEQKEKIEKLLEEISSSIDEGSYTKAKLAIMQAKQLLNSVSTSEEKKANKKGKSSKVVSLLKFLIFLGVLGYASWVFILPKLIPELVERGILDEEILERLQELGMKVS